jgi:hypothetical protein
VNAVPIGAAEPVALAPEDSDSRKINEEDIDSHNECTGHRLLILEQQSLQNQVEHKKGQAEQCKGCKKAQKQLDAFASPLKIVVDEARLAPQILSFARGSPETVKAKRRKIEQKVGNRNWCKFAPVSLESKRGFVLCSDTHTCAPLAQLPSSHCYLLGSSAVASG